MNCAWPPGDYRRDWRQRYFILTRSGFAWHITYYRDYGVRQAAAAGLQKILCTHVHESMQLQHTSMSLHGWSIVRGQTCSCSSKRLARGTHVSSSSVQFGPPSAAILAAAVLLLLSQNDDEPTAVEPLAGCEVTVRGPAADVPAPPVGLLLCGSVTAMPCITSSNSSPWQAQQQLARIPVSSCACHLAH